MSELSSGELSTNRKKVPWGRGSHVAVLAATPRRLHLASADLNLLLFDLACRYLRYAERPLLCNKLHDFMRPVCMHSNGRKGKGEVRREDR